MTKSTSQMDVGETYQIVVQGVTKIMKVASKDYDDDGNLIVRSVEVLA